MARVDRRFPPAPSFPCNDIVWTARHACNPPRAATFLATISDAERFPLDGEGPAAAASGATNTTPKQIVCSFLSMDFILLSPRLNGRLSPSIARSSGLFQHQSDGAAGADLYR